MQKKLFFPTIGQRILKTSLAVFLCLVFYHLRGYRGVDMSAEAAITAIICIQPYVHDTKEYALNRLAGTLIGALWGFLFLLIVPLFPAVDGIALYALMGVGILISLYSAVVIRMPDTSGLAAIVFICVVIAYPDVEPPLHQAFHRVLDVLVGTGIAIGVNVVHLPRTRCPDQLFFVRTKDLTADPLSPVPPAALFHLRSLNNDGARICLISEHAPAFFLSQLGATRLNAPMIVMDGAGIYDANENVYLATTCLSPASSSWLMNKLSGMGISYYIYTVHKNRNYIYHHGTMSREEQLVHQQMKRSPYRQYLDEDTFDPADIVYIKVVAKEERADRILLSLKDSLSRIGLRAVLRPQVGLPDCGSLYFYASDADTDHAEAQIREWLQENQPGLQVREIFPAKHYRSENDAIRLVHRVSSAYEPLSLVHWFRQIHRKDKDR